MIDCSTDFALGVKIKSECTLKPISTTVSGNITYHGSNDPVFSTDSSVLYGSGLSYSSNVFYASQLGKAPSSGYIKKTPAEFDKTLIKEELYGRNEPVGPEWGINEPEKSELQTDVQTFYLTLLNNLLNGNYSTSTTSNII
jgi:hypothetical protein